MSSVQRLKERGGAGAKITALKPNKGLVEFGHKDVAIGSSKMSSGKENPRSTSRGKAPPPSQKPAIRSSPMQRIDKTSAISAKESGSYARWSTSSLPKGKTADSSNFAHILSDVRTGRLSRHSGSDGLDKPLAKPSAEASFKDKTLKDFRPLAKSREQKGNSSSNSRAWDEKQGNRSKIVEVCRNKIYLNTGLKEVPKNDVARIGDRMNKDILDSNRENSDESRQYGVMALDSCKHMSSLGSNVEKKNLDFSLNESGEKYTKSLAILENGPALKSLGLMDGLSSKDGCNMGEAENHCAEGQTSLNLDGEKQVNDSELLGSTQQLFLFSNLVGSRSQASQVAEVSENLDAVVSTNLNSEGLIRNSLIGLSVSDDFREHKCSGECKAVQVANKYPSRLREKLVFLEGKVNKIASEIKRTKEMLDQNNPNASKLILTDIQDTIAGIEKAMGDVMDDSKSKLVISDNVENAKSLFRHKENNNSGMVGSTSTSVNGLRAEELEARLFPHHKLLKSRAQVGSLREKDQSCQPTDEGFCGGSAVEDKLLGPMDENPIALEFLASLEKNQSEVKTSNKNVRIECSIKNATDFSCSESSTGQDISRKVMSETLGKGVQLTTDENFEQCNNQETPSMLFQEESEDSSGDLLFEIGVKSSTGGWFVSEGESVLLVHGDNTCSFYDITNSEEKAEYKTPAGLSHNLWGDCWLIRAPSSDGCTGRYVVAASAGSCLDSGFCSWDFYGKDIQAFRVEDGTSTFGLSSRTVLGSLSNREVNKRSALSTIVVSQNQQWWYKPCGPLLVSTASSQKVVSIYDIRDGDLVMKWETSKPVHMMEYSSPLQWRSRGKVVLAETEGISLWDVGSLNPQALLSLPLFGKRITALHVNNTDAELGGGVRQRVSSSEVEGNDGVFCTNEAINVLDFRLPSGVGLKMSKNGTLNSSSIFSCGDSIFLGVTDTRLKHSTCSQVQQFSLRKGKLRSTYALPESNTSLHHSSLTQVWGNSQFVMGICGSGLFVFDTSKDVGIPCFSVNHENTRNVREVIGSDNLYSPTFDYLASRVLVISRDRPALWRYLS
ncbi:KIN14B-interacting protein At4g14310-like [Aristolochia californica]|uniref:KIN14B-interacting protein At4g14310-like n=1 Tax=Aristolochia californica TaxID=171875 RepID=UPI0035E08C71